MVGVDLSNSNLLLSDASLYIIFARELINLLVSPTSKVLNEWFEVILNSGFYFTWISKSLSLF